MKPLLKVIQLHKNQELLIAKATHNNRKAQQALFDMYAPKMLSVCRCYIKDLQQAEAVMLNGFFNVFTQIKSFQHQGSFEGWVRKIMVRESISFIRQQKTMSFIEDNHGFSVPSNYVSDENLNVEDIQNLIDALPTGYKMVFVMYAIEGYKHSEIAKILDISEGTSKSQLFKARQLLKEQLNALNPEGNGTK